MMCVNKEQVTFRPPVEWAPANRYIVIFHSQEN